jgi:hypothetical protein
VEQALTVPKYPAEVFARKKKEERSLASSHLNVHVLMKNNAQLKTIAISQVKHFHIQIMFILILPHSAYLEISA